MPVEQIPAFNRHRDGVLFAQMWERPMCEKCVELDQKIKHYHRLIARMPDPQTNEALRKLIEEMEKHKAELHPKQER